MKRITYGIGGALLLLAVMTCNRIIPFALYVFAAVLHELGHIWTAKRLKIKLKAVRIGIFGAKIETDERLISYKSEFILAIAGPAANLLTAAIALAIAKLIGYSPESLLDGATELLTSGQSGAAGYIGFFSVSSLAHAVTNLMPIKRLDGGRALYCITAAISSERIADRVLTAATAISLFVIWTASLYLMLRISSGIGIYVFAACIFMTALRRNGAGV